MPSSSYPTFPITGLPIVGYPSPLDTSPFVLGSSLLPINASQLAYARIEAGSVEAKQADLLRSLHPSPTGLQSGPFMEWLQRRQQLRRAAILREAGLPEADSEYFL